MFLCHAKVKDKGKTYLFGMTSTIMAFNSLKRLHVSEHKLSVSLFFIFYFIYLFIFFFFFHSYIYCHHYTYLCYLSFLSAVVTIVSDIPSVVEKGFTNQIF